MGLLLLAYRSITCSRNPHFIIIMASQGHTLGRKMSFWHAFILGVCMTAQLRVELYIRPCLKLDATLSKWGISGCLSCWRKAALSEVLLWVSFGGLVDGRVLFCMNWVHLLWNTEKLFSQCPLLWQRPRGTPSPAPGYFLCLNGCRVGRSLLSLKCSCVFSSHRTWGWAALLCSL